MLCYFNTKIKKYIKQGNGGKCKVDGILGLIYIVLGYWAMGVTVYANKIRIGTAGNLFFNRLFLGMILGWILIPIAILRVVFFSK